MEHEEVVHYVYSPTPIKGIGENEIENGKRWTRVLALHEDQLLPQSRWQTIHINTHADGIFIFHL